MKTILIMAQALAEAYGLEILRLDIQFNSIKIFMLVILVWIVNHVLRLDKMV